LNHEYFPQIKKNTDGVICVHPFYLSFLFAADGRRGSQIVFVMQTEQHKENLLIREIRGCVLFWLIAGSAQKVYT
jgi:hypothetical protein